MTAKAILLCPARPLFAPETKIVMISALQNTKLILDALEKGAKGYISKPLEMSSDSFKVQLKQDILEALENDD